MLRMEPMFINILLQEAPSVSREDPWGFLTPQQDKLQEQKVRTTCTHICLGNCSPAIIATLSTKSSGIRQMDGIARGGNSNMRNTYGCDQGHNL